MIKIALNRFMHGTAGSIRLDGISIGAAGIGLCVAAGAAILIGGPGFDYDDQAPGMMGLHSDGGVIESPAPIERRTLVEVLPTRTGTDCAPVYSGGPVACTTPISQRCELWQMTDGSTRQFCTRL